MNFGLIDNYVERSHRGPEIDPIDQTFPISVSETK